MIVRCENCGTEFGFDDRQIGEGVTVRCSVCKHVFKVESPGAQPQGWYVRTTDDMSFTAPDVATLREWIDEGRLHPDDQVSRTGRNWVRLGDMAEFARAFAGFEEVAPVASPVQVRAAPPGPSPQSQRPTLSPPRSAPPQAPAPIAAKQPPRPPAPPPSRPVIRGPEPDHRGYDELELEDDDDDAPTVAVMPAVMPEPARVPGPATRQPQFQPEPEFETKDESEEFERRDDSGSDLDAFEAEGKRRGVGPGLIAFLGVIAAVGVVFGIPDIREKVLSLGQGTDEVGQPQQGSAAATGPEIAAAEAAMRGLGIAELARAEADLQRAIEAGGEPNSLAAMKVALADLLLSRAVAYEIAAALDPAQRDSYRDRASDDREHGERIVDTLEGAPDLDRASEVRALARLAAGRPEAEVLPHVPEAAAETRLIVRAAVLWQDLEAPVPEGLVAGLVGLPRRSGLGESVLALALVRAGDAVEARNVAERLLVAAEDQIVAQAVLAHLASEGEGETEGELEAGETGDDGQIATAPPRPEGGDDGGSSADGSAGGSSFDRLVERGCSQVSGGDAGAGIKTLLRAFDIKPNDLDVLVCLADGYAAQGSSARASTFYDRALSQSPSNIPALRGAAKIAVKTGAHERAKSLYERLLAADPGNAAAKAYLAKSEPKPEPEPEPEPEKPAPEPPAEDTAG